MTNQDSPYVQAQMLIRKPASIVFNAFIDPAITTNFWFTKSSGRLEKGKTVKWEWEMNGVSANVQVDEVIQDKSILIRWGDPPTYVEFIFKAVSPDSTYVVIKNYGFKLDGVELTAALMDNMGGFTTVLDGMKAFLEHNIKLNLIADKYPGKLTTAIR